MKEFLTKYEDEERVFNVFIIAVYWMMIFPKVPNHIESTVVDLIEQVNNQVDPVRPLSQKPFVH